MSKSNRVKDLDSKESDVRLRAVYALGRIGSEKAIEPLIKALTTDKEGDVRWRAAHALERIGSEKAIEPLIKALTTDKESDVRWRAAHALGSIGDILSGNGPQGTTWNHAKKHNEWFLKRRMCHWSRLCHYC